MAARQNLFSGPVLELVPEPPDGERVRVALGTVPPLVAEVTREAVTALDLRRGCPGARQLQGHRRAHLRLSPAHRYESHHARLRSLIRA